jgi:hypothetical protein
LVTKNVRQHDDGARLGACVHAFGRVIAHTCACVRACVWGRVRRWAPQQPARAAAARHQPPAAAFLPLPCRSGLQARSTSPFHGWPFQGPHPSSIPPIPSISSFPPSLTPSIHPSLGRTQLGSTPKQQRTPPMRAFHDVTLQVAADDLERPLGRVVMADGAARGAAHLHANSGAPEAPAAAAAARRARGLARGLASRGLRRPACRAPPMRVRRRWQKPRQLSPVGPPAAAPGGAARAARAGAGPRRARRRDCRRPAEPTLRTAANAPAADRAGCTTLRSHSARLLQWHKSQSYSTSRGTRPAARHWARALNRCEVRNSRGRPILSPKTAA